jgi:Baseplate J-like protein
VNSHLKNFSRLFNQEGTARDERYLPALNPGNMTIDDRRLKDLLLYIQRFSGKVLFQPGMQKAAGAEPQPATTAEPQPATTGEPLTWKDFLQKDIAILLADIAACSVQEIRQAYHLLEERFDRERTGGGFNGLINHVFSVFEKLDKWYYKAAADSADSRLRKDLQLYIQSYLSKKLADLRQIRLHAQSLLLEENIRSVPLYIFSNTDKVWGDMEVGNAADRSFGERVFIGRDDEEKLINASLRLKDIYDTALHVMEQVVSNSNTYLEETLHAKKDHQPHIALMIVFLELYGYARDEINRIPQRHLNFYYEEVLGIGRRAAVSDSVFVNFELEKGFDACMISKGSLLSAGKDALNKERMYATVRDLVVNKVKVNALRTLLIRRDRQDRVLQYYPDATGLPAADASGPAAAGDAPENSLPLFGNPAGAPGGSIGFAIASAQFYLTKGERNVVVRFELENELSSLPLDGDILEVWLTGEKGWLSSGRVSDGVRLNPPGTQESKVLELSFTVSIAQPSAIIAFDKNIHEGGFDTDLPMLQLLLNYPSPPQEEDEQAQSAYQSRIAQLDSLQKIRPVNTIITVRVGSLDAGASFDGVRDLNLQNHEAVLDATKPFFPFTSVPKVGSSFYIGCDDLFYKPIQRLSLNLEWMLPDHFRSYYDKYMPPYDSNKFKASFSILKKKKWYKVLEPSLIDTDAKDPRWRSLKMDLRQLKEDSKEEEGQGGVARFDPSKMNGMLKLKLLYPDFGHGIYSQLITSTVMEKASSKIAMPDFYKMIKHQLHDSVFSIKLPSDTDDRDGSFKVVVYEILESNETDEKARSMMMRGISGIVRYYNERYVQPGPAGTPETPMPQAQDQRVLVNDNSLLERIMRRLRIISSTTSYDKDRENVQDVAGEVNQTILPAADFILPSEQELAGIITNVTNSAIDQIVIKVVDRIIVLRKDGASGQAIATIFKEEFEQANKVINDMIARKIATVLMAGEMPPAPYTPLINMISVNYLSSRSCNGEEDRFFRITPFGHAAIGTNDAFFDEAAGWRAGGLLFIGLGGCNPGQELSLLFRFAEGTGRTDKTPPAIHWKYLVDNEWKSLPDECLVSDGTYGLQSTGIVEFSLPLGANNTNSLFGDPGLHWLCASVSGDTDTFPQLAGISCNAVVACFSNQGNDPRHAALPLPGGSIVKLVDKLPAIKKIQQLVASFGGKMKEEQDEYYTRVSERLRHKSRAVNNWDYERLVLEKFPEVFKIKCLNDYFNGRFVRGHVTVVPVCDLRNRAGAGVDRLEPRGSYTLLRQIEQYLADRTSPFVKVHAVNPQLSHVLIRCRVKFNKGVDKGYALKRLDKELIDLLTPWATAGGKLTFSAKIYASNVISFIDKREYVDYVEGLEMLQYCEDERGERVFCRAANQDISLVETQFINGHTLLVSAPAHRIGLIE